MRPCAPLAALLLAACGQPQGVACGPQPGPVCGPAEQEYVAALVTVVAVNPPKHFAVSVSTPSGQVLRNVARSKHCKGWRTRAKVGTPVEARFRVVRTPFDQATSGQAARYQLDQRHLNRLLCRG